MASFVFTDAFVSIGGTDVSDHVKSVSLSYSADTPEKTAMGDGTHIYIAGGLKNWSVDIEFYQDFASSNVDSILFAGVGTSMALIIRPVASSSVGATNPNFTGSGILESYNPLEGSVGDMAMTKAAFKAGGTLSRATS